MIKFDEQGRRFQLRIAAILLHEDCVLLHHAHEGHWALPGGRVEWGEDAATTAERELQEELGVKAEAGRLVWIIENFFHDGKRDVHEVGMYFLMNLLPDDPLFSQEGEFVSEEGPQLSFGWHALDTLPELEVYPEFIKDALSQLPQHSVHIIQR